MNKYYYDSVLRMSVEMSLFMVPGGFTINNMADLLNLDKSIIREDVYNLFTFDAMKGLLSIDLDPDCLDYFYGNDYFEDVELENYDVVEDIKCDQEMGFEDDEEEDDEIKLYQYITSFLELSDLQDDIKNINSGSLYHFEKNHIIFDKFKVICRTIPREFDSQKSWKDDIITQLQGADKDEDWGKIIKSIENTNRSCLNNTSCKSWISYQ